MLAKEDFMVIQALAQRGVYQRDLAETVGVHPKTVQRALKRGEASSPRPHRRPSLLDGYRAEVDRLLAEGVWNAVVIFRALAAQGYRGGISILRDYIRPKRALRPGRATVRFETAPGQHYVESRVMLSSCTRGRSGEPFHTSWPPRTSHNSYRDSSHSRRSLESRRGFGPLRTGVPTRSKASRFITRSLWT